MGRGRRGTWALSQTRIWALNGHFIMLYVGTYAVFACSPSPLLPPSIPLTRAAHPSPCRYRAAPIVFPHSPLGSTTAATVQRPWRSLHRPPRGGAIVVASIHCDGGDGSSRSGSHGGRVPRADLIGSVVRAFRGRRVGLVALSRRPGRPLSRRRRWATVAVAAAAMAAATVAGTAAVGERGDMRHLWAPPATEASSMVTAAAVAAVPAPVAALTPGHHGAVRPLPRRTGATWTAPLPLRRRCSPSPLATPRPSLAAHRAAPPASSLCTRRRLRRQQPPPRCWTTGAPPPPQMHCRPPFGGGRRGGR